jgi:ABC-type multidrug transport system ATPase subunit
MRAREHLDWLLRGREREARERARRIAESFELPLKSRVRTYSHGMKRQLLFAAALAPRVAVRILDEASEGLDPSRRGVLLETLLADAREGTTIVLSSHHLGEVDRACASLVFLHQGRVVHTGSANAVRGRAARLMRLRFASEREREDFESRVGLLPCKLARRDRTLAILELDDGDPRAFFAALAARRELPAPSAIEYGEPSLEELYRDVYGVEAC